MHITTKVTERDKKLLVFLGAFVLLVGFVWLLMKPLCDDIIELNSKIALAKNEQQNSRIAVLQLESREEKRAENTAALLAEAAPYYARMENQAIDRLVTLAALSYGFRKSDLRELVISNPDECLQLEPYLSVTERKDSEPLPGIYGANVKFTVRGMRETLQRFCNDLVMNDDAVRVTAYTWQAQEQDEDNWLLTMQLQILMTDAEQQTGTQTPDGEPPAG